MELHAVTLVTVLMRCNASHPFLCALVVCTNWMRGRGLFMGLHAVILASPFLYIQTEWEAFYNMNVVLLGRQRRWRVWTFSGAACIHFIDAYDACINAWKGGHSPPLARILPPLQLVNTAWGVRARLVIPPPLPSFFNHQLSPPLDNFSKWTPDAHEPAHP